MHGMVVKVASETWPNWTMERGTLLLPALPPYYHVL